MGYKDAPILVLPAAGLGTRLGASDRPKALHELGGRPLIDWVVAALQDKVRAIYVVASPKHFEILSTWAQSVQLPSYVVVQETPSGSSTAVRAAMKVVSAQREHRHGVIVAWADQVGLQGAECKSVAELCKDKDALVVPIAQVADPYVWLHISGSRIMHVGRRRDGDTAPAVGLSDVGLFGLGQRVVERFLLHSHIGGQGREADFVYDLPLLSTDPTKLHLPTMSSINTLGINTLDDLVRAESVLHDD